MIEIIQELADSKLPEIEENGFIEGGHNGPYYDPETPVRVCAHWIVTYAYLYKKKKNESYKAAVRKLVEFIYAAQETNGTFKLRNKEGKDHVNGTVGTAWTIEGLIEAAFTLNDNKYYESACKAFNAQMFVQETGMWKIRECDDRILPYDITYNHQLWLCAAGAIICSYQKDPDIEEKIKIFMERSKTIFRVYKDGLIYHYVFRHDGLPNLLKSTKRYGIEVLMRKLGRPSLEYKEQGYHYFTMLGFSLVHKYYRNLPFFQTKAFLKAVAYSFDFNNVRRIESNRNAKKDATGLGNRYLSECNIYGYGYNSPAYELLCVINEFAPGKYRNKIQECLHAQMKLTYNEITGSFCRNTEDAATLNARVYEYVRGLDWISDSI